MFTRALFLAAFAASLLMLVSAITNDSLSGKNRNLSLSLLRSSGQPGSTYRTRKDGNSSTGNGTFLGVLQQDGGSTKNILSVVDDASLVDGRVHDFRNWIDFTDDLRVPFFLRMWPREVQSFAKLREEIANVERKLRAEHVSSTARLEQRLSEQFERKLEQQGTELRAEWATDFSKLRAKYAHSTARLGHMFNELT